jgi:UDP-N-acetylglucosamine--N-acetylmuramyl-(pentapeptide) pyrophosphoryl-undecaprenol N-acetylglucosamine transferase
MGVKFIPITAGRLNRFFSFYSLIALLKTPIGFIQSFYYLLKEQPDLIVSFGGFTGMPVVINGWLLSIPSLIHEQSLKMGLSNYISSFFAKNIALSFPSQKKSSDTKVIITGNPIRKEFLSPQEPSKRVKDFIKSSNRRKKPVILITAGNQGSHFINLIVEDKLTDLTNIAAIIHQTGDSKYDDYSNLEKHTSENYFVSKWIDSKDLSFILDNTDLAISRAGMNTLIELSLKSAPSLIIPIPVGREQKNNAEYFKKLGLGEVLEEKKLTPEIMIKKIKEALDRRIGLKQLANNAKKEIVMDAQKKLTQQILIMLNNQTNFPNS